MSKKIKLGDYNRLRIVKKVDFGLYLAGGELHAGTVVALLHRHRWILVWLGRASAHKELEKANKNLEQTNRELQQTNIL